VISGTEASSTKILVESPCRQESLREGRLNLHGIKEETNEKRNLMMASACFDLGKCSWIAMIQS
jgi:hypothetical protein